MSVPARFSGDDSFNPNGITSPIPPEPEVSPMATGRQAQDWKSPEESQQSRPDSFLAHYYLPKSFRWRWVISPSRHTLCPKRVLRGRLWLAANSSRISLLNPDRWHLSGTTPSGTALGVSEALGESNEDSTAGESEESTHAGTGGLSGSASSGEQAVNGKGRRGERSGRFRNWSPLLQR